MEKLFEVLFQKKQKEIAAERRKKKKVFWV